MCKVVNVQHSNYTVYVGRPGHGRSGPFGNPFRLGRDYLTPSQGVALFRKWFVSPAPDAVEYRRLVRARIGPDDVLGCFCKPYRPCHGDVIAEYVEAGYPACEGDSEDGLICCGDDIPF